MQRKKKRRSLIGVLSMALLLLFFLGNLFVKMRGERLMELIGTGTYEGAVILGARVYEGGALSPMLAERMDQGLSYLEEGKVKTLFLTGGADEVKAMKDYALEKGVGENVLVLDEEGVNTLASMRHAKATYGKGKILISTQSYHLPRALFLAEAIGLDATGEPCEQRVYKGQWVRELREILARNKALINVIGIKF